MTLSSLRRSALVLLRGPMRSRGPLAAADLAQAVETSFWQVRAFYLLVVVIAFYELVDVYEIYTSGARPEPLWPVFWLRWVSHDVGVYVIGLALPTTALLAVLLAEAWWPRFFVFLALLQFAGFDNSFGSINHYMHYPLFVSFMLLFFPAGRAPRPSPSVSTTMRYLFPIFAAQLVIGWFYTLSGLNKALYGFFPGANQVSSFAPEALPRLVFMRWEQTGEETMLGNLFASNVELAWPVYLVVIYLEVMFLFVAFRPQLHKMFGVLLATFHFGVWLVMGIMFPYQPVMVALLFLWSPFVVFDKCSPAQRLGQLPGVDLVVWLVRWLRPSGQRSVPSPT